MSEYLYPGNELELFARARCWKSYWRNVLRPFIRGAVLEVGAGNGNNTRFLAELNFEHWVCLEPDRKLSEALRAGLPPQARIEVVPGTLADLPASRKFDAILYLDVLEHIERDAEELRLASRHLRPGGHVAVLAPAHEWLFSPFDRAVGHFRRYDRRTLRAATPPELTPVLLRYLDAVGMLASLGNRFLLKQPMPTQKQLDFWDQRLVPISRRVDALFGYRLGKSIVGVWRKAE